MKLTDAEFMQIAQSHKSAADHSKLAEHFLTHAKEHEADAEMSERLAANYEKSEPRLAGEERHYAAHSREAAEAMRTLARLHEELATEHAHHAHA